jgi:hypothetical protein
MLTLENRTLEGICEATRAGRERLLEGIAAAAPRWDDAVLAPEVPERTYDDAAAWTPRTACTHVLAASWLMTDMALFHVEVHRSGARADLARFRADWHEQHREELDTLWQSLAAAERALDVAGQVLGRHEANLERIPSDGLDAPWEPGQFNSSYLRSFGAEASATVRALLSMNAIHLHDHGEQLQAAGK